MTASTKYKFIRSQFYNVLKCCVPVYCCVVGEVSLGLPRVKNSSGATGGGGPHDEARCTIKFRRLAVLEVPVPA